MKLLTRRFLIGALVPTAALAATGALRLVPARPAGTPREAFQISAADICGPCAAPNADDPACGFHYRRLAASMAEYAQARAAPYLQAQDLDDLLRLLREQNPVKLKIDAAHQTVTAMWGATNPENPSAIILDRAGAPAHLRIDLARKIYAEMWLRGGEFNRPGGDATYTLLEPGKIVRQWSDETGVSNSRGPAHMTYDRKHNELALLWSLNDAPAFVDGSPTEARIDLNTNLVYYEDFAAGDGLRSRRMHRPGDNLHRRLRDRNTGTLAYERYFYHGDDPLSPETTREVFYAAGGIVQAEVWQTDGKIIPRPANFIPPAHRH